MSIARHHAEWLSLVETSGPFLSMPVLLRVFPQGLDGRETERVARLRAAYEVWLARPQESAIHRTWVQQVFRELLEYTPELLVEGQAIPPGLEAAQPQFGEVLRPDWVLKHRDVDGRPQLLISLYPPTQKLDGPVAGKVWKATPGTRMMELLHATDVPLGMLTNGEHWMLVYAPRGETTGFASWYADLWMQEPITLRAFQSLLHLRRFLGVTTDETISALFAASSKDQQEVTDQLGYQVRRAVEMLVQAFDRMDAESGRQLLAGMPEKELYDSALTVMMRLVFLFSAEERKLLLLGDPLYDQHYAVSTLSELLREKADQHGEEVLERRHDAWCRLLATFRAVYAGVQHESMRLPPYGGTLFDPDRYPFLEGRARNTKWTNTEAKPLPINNRVVLHLLEALQILRVKIPGGGRAEARRLSFRALDIEQIGHVYEGLLDHTAKRASEVILGLAGAKDKESEVSLSKLEQLAARSTSDLVEYLHEETGKTENSLNRLMNEPPEVDNQMLLIACGQDPRLSQRVNSFAALLREDSFGQLVVIPEGSVYVTRGSDRRSTGTHYTPRSLTEPIVQYTLEPLVYVGPVEGRPKQEWQLKSPKEILELKVCDMAMGSGAFLVQACRYLGERLVEAWEKVENDNAGTFVTTPEGGLSTGSASERLLPADAAERLAIARRTVADRCLYGVDINPMAVEMAKLSLWLITLQRDRPFTFLDHALKCGDSLLGIVSLQQVENFSVRSGPVQTTISTVNLFRYIKDAAAKRRALESLPSNDHIQIETKKRLYAEAEVASGKIRALADCLIAFELRGLDGEAYRERRTITADEVESAMRRPQAEFEAYAREKLDERRTLNWPVEFPEVFDGGGFDAFIGNPPFLGGKRISTVWGVDYHGWLKHAVGITKGAADLCAYFFLRAVCLLRESGAFGLLATNTICQGDTREVGLAQIVKVARITRARPSTSWPGVAGVEVALVHLIKGLWSGDNFLDENKVENINSYLTVGTPKADPMHLHPVAYATKGTYVYGEGFVLDQQTYEKMINADGHNKKCLKRYLVAQDFTSHYKQESSRWVITFGNMLEEEAQQYPLLYEHVLRTVKPYRDALTRQVHETCFWKHWDRRDELYLELSRLKRAIVCPEVSKYCCFELIPTDVIFSSMVNVIASDSLSLFAVLQSAFHSEWAWKHGSTMRNDLRYTTSDCFHTFPMPLNLSNLLKIGNDFQSHRSMIMQIHKEGLTKTYNRFHCPTEELPDIVQLRALQLRMDCAVAAAYGWGDLDLNHRFHETKQGVRYTISESARRTILDRLLALNCQRYEEEVRAGLHEKKKTARGKRKVTGMVREDVATYGNLELDL